MAKHVLLNNVEHKNLKIQPDLVAQPYQQAMCIPVYPAEARLAQAHYPLMFARNEHGAYQLVALTGVEKGENVFVNDGQWEAPYRPLVVEKGPFLIGRNAPDSEQLSIHVDMEHPSISEEQGEPVFLAHGGNTDYIDHIGNILSTLHENQPKHQLLVDLCNELQLIESMVLDIEQPGQSPHRLSGFFTINEEALAALGGEQLNLLHQQGLLEIVYMLLASQAQINTLMQRRANLRDA